MTVVIIATRRVVGVSSPGDVILLQLARRLGRLYTVERVREVIGEPT